MFLSVNVRFGRGKEYFKSKIDQLNRYLTWRDTKTAVVLFCKNQNFSGVDEQIKEGAAEHEQFKSFEGKRAESWYDYKFHFEENPEREISLAVLVFHISPES